MLKKIIIAMLSLIALSSLGIGQSGTMAVAFAGGAVAPKVSWEALGVTRVVSLGIIVVDPDHRHH